MSEVISVIADHYVWLGIGWFVLFVGGLLIMRRAYWSFADPLVLSMALNVAAGLTGVIAIMFVMRSDEGVVIRGTLFVCSMAMFFYFYKSAFTRNWDKRRKIMNREFVIEAPVGWQISLLVIVAIVCMVNNYVNTNFSSHGSSLRFAAIQSPVLNYASLSVSSYPTIIFAFTRSGKVRVLSVIVMLALFLSRFGGAHSKGAYLSLFMLVVYWGFSRGYLNVENIMASIRYGKVSKKVLKIIAGGLVALLGGGILLLAQGWVSLNGVFVRIFLGFDSPIIFITNGDIFVERDVIGYGSFLEVWLKPFIKNIFGLEYKYENISQYLSYLATGYYAHSYAETSWQPNNNLIVDFLVVHGYWAVFLSGLFGYALGWFALKLKVGALDWYSFPFFVLLVASPFGLFLDSQYFVIRLFLSLLIVCGVSLLWWALGGGMRGLTKL